jgi:glycosyltransferase involved in cell wall biosynthesis
MDVSIIIATQNRCDQLDRCLAAVQGISSERDWELVIVDNGSTDGTSTVIQKFAARAPMPVRYVFEPQSGLGNAHNAGIRVARGKILAFTDDDCYPAADFVSQVYASFESDPLLGYIGGRIMLHDPDDLPMTINESIVPLTFPARSYRQSGDVMGANMAFRKDVLLRINGFDPIFGVGALFNSEDTDAVGRASAMGWKGKYCPEVVVRHHHGRRSPAAISRLWKSYSIGRGAYDMKNLLRGEFWWFARSVYGLRRRYRLARGIVVWEQVGKVKYLSVRLRQALAKLSMRVRS